MAKGSGNTRTTRQRTTSNSQWKGIVNNIAKDGSIDYDNWLTLSENQQNKALQEARFTGAVSDDLSNGVVYMLIAKDDMVRRFQDALVNEMQGYGVNDESYTVLYKDGTTKHLDTISNDFDNVKINSNMNRQAYTNAKNALKLRDVAAIIQYSADGQPCYYLAPKGEKAMRDYGFDFYKKGVKR